MHELSTQPDFSKSHLDESTHLHWKPWGKSAHLYPTGQGLAAHLPPGLAQPGTENDVVSITKEKSVSSINKADSFLYAEEMKNAVGNTSNL